MMRTKWTIHLLCTVHLIGSKFWKSMLWLLIEKVEKEEGEQEMGFNSIIISRRSIYIGVK